MPSGVYIRTPEMKIGKYPRTSEHNRKISETFKRKGIKPPIRIYTSKYLTKEDYLIAHRSNAKQWRILNRGRYLLYLSNWRRKNKEKRRLYKKKYYASSRNPFPLSISIIQQVYEDNIKKYGTLTCYLCEKPIEFGRDSLEHKIPISRGGTNERNNLDIACMKCNLEKNTKTEKEFKALLQKRQR